MAQLGEPLLPEQAGLAVVYETFNEPLRARDWSGTIRPYHERVIPAIRAQDPDDVIVLGNRQWDQRPDEAAANPVDGNNRFPATSPIVAFDEGED